MTRGFAAMAAVAMLGSCAAHAAEGFGDAPSAAGCAQSADFIDVSKGSPGVGSDKPYLRVGCTDTHLVVQSNGIPSFRYRQVTPTPLRAQRYTWTIPRHPRPAREPRQVPLLGPIAIAVDGLPIFGPNEAPEHGTADPYLDKLLDRCNGHTAQRGDYHFHARPDCLFETVEGRAGRVVGYAFDGYPILAPYECTDASCASVRKLRSSWRTVSRARNAWEANRYEEGSGDLDRCNGKTRPDGSYAYFATDGFPYFLACYHGVATPPGRGPGSGEPKGPPPGKGPPPPGKGGPPPR